MGFWNNSKDGSSDSEKEASKVDSAAANPKNPTVLAAQETAAAQKSVAAEAATPEQNASSHNNKCSRTEQGLVDRYGVIRSALGKGTVIQGKLSFDTPVRIDGSLNGDVYSSQVLIVGESGEIEADIEVSSLIVMGKVKGKIKARERIELWSGGVLEGEIDTPAFVMEENSKFDGSCAMGASKSSAKKIDKQKDADSKESKQSKSSSQPAASKEVRVH